MIEIKKSKEPKELLTYRLQEYSSYGDMPHDIKEIVISSLMEEQGHLCAYCMRRIPFKDGHPKVTIEHLQPQNAISDKSDWNIISEIYLSTFSFKKLVIYNDLNMNNWSGNTLKKIDGLLFNPEPRGIDTYEPYDLDKIDSDNLYQVLDADSSQMEVIEVIKKSNNLVVEGPPGTGKSQTIVNLIAELMAQKKSVLFVSEKMAALEVVKSRLDSVGLGKFVLELHSNKTRRLFVK